MITLKGNKIVYEETYTGSRAGAREPAHKEQTLTAQEMVKLKRFIVEKNLLRSGSLRYPPGNAPYRYYDLTLKIRWRGRRSFIKVAGPVKSDKMKNSRLYQGSNSLLDYLMALINNG
jgi:hypothetical protein